MSITDHRDPWEPQLSEIVPPMNQTTPSTPSRGRHAAYRFAVVGFERSTI